MVYIEDEQLTKWLKEDIGYYDLTTNCCEINEKKASIEITSRDECVICGSEEIKRMAKMLDIDTLSYIPSKTKVMPNTSIFLAKGEAKNIHKLWKVAINLLSFASSISTKTKTLVNLAQSINPNIHVGSTRKSIPGTRALSTKAVLCGDGAIHRATLSETFLMFDEHKKFFNSHEDIIEKLKSLKYVLVEKKILIEVKEFREAVIFAPYVDILQLDKVSFDNIKKIKEYIDKNNLSCKIVAAGGINEKNIQDYVKTGVDFIVTSSMFWTDKPIDFEVKIEAL